MTEFEHEWAAPDTELPPRTRVCLSAEDAEAVLEWLGWYVDDMGLGHLPHIPPHYAQEREVEFGTDLPEAWQAPYEKLVTFLESAV